MEAPFSATRSFTGPLKGMKIIEIGSMGPGPFAAMMLADLGADVIRVDRVHGASLPGPNADFRQEAMHRGRRSIAVDLKKPEGRAVVLELVESADALIEGFRPGVAERLGIGPEVCQKRNPKLVYGRMTGFGQSGPLAQTPGHDINYIAQSGMLSLIGREGGKPTPPLSLVGDFGGGGMLLALGVLAALWEAHTSGQGQIIDAAMTDGAALLGTAFFGFAHNGTWNPERGKNLVDTGAPFYDTYETSDGKWIAVGALEAHFYQDLLKVLSISPAQFPEQYDTSSWPDVKKVFTRIFLTRTRDEWVVAAHGFSPCLSPVLTLAESINDPHAQARNSFPVVNGMAQPAPAPRFSRTPAHIDGPPPLPGEHTREALSAWGISAEQLATWEESRVIRDGPDEPTTVPAG